MDDQQGSHVTGTPAPGAGDVQQAWGRVTAWLERHDPAVFAALGGPGSREAVERAERRMGLTLPPELRQWLLVNGIDAGVRPDMPSCLVTRDCAVPLPGGHMLLGLTDIQRVYLSRTALEEAEPSEDPDCPFWRRTWVPIAAERDGLYGTFLDTATGTVGTWAEASCPEEGVYASLSAFFQHAADRLEGVSSGDWTGPGKPAASREPGPLPQDEPIRVWARTHGILVNDRGRVPAAIREAYEASRR
ncbi:histone-like nucleoid-structuring protein Lsr2 [Kitasatospora sp. NPDC057542]|uniref:Lsr2 family DNA-binding protein n=1 Tax=Streptomycetaceae TaxID=2062 RepID=UPI001CC97C70|nr:histone-like nucleoid-structuring protein Lsr2 [Streptomyces sp. LS1784]